MSFSPGERAIACTQNKPRDVEGYATTVKERHAVIMGAADLQ